MPMLTQHKLICEFDNSHLFIYLRLMAAMLEPRDTIVSKRHAVPMLFFTCCKEMFRFGVGKRRVL